MPIYAYKCSSCGHAKDVLQKISDDALTVCPACGASTFSKQITAAGFQLKGSGWYVSDFRGSGDGANSGVGKESSAPAASPAPAGESSASSAPSASVSAPASAPAASPAPASAAAKPVAASSASTAASS